MSGKLNYRKGEGWAWLDGTPYNWMNWDDGEPSYRNDVARLVFTGQWHGTKLKKKVKYRYICERGKLEKLLTIFNTTVFIHLYLWAYESQP